MRLNRCVADIIDRVGEHYGYEPAMLVGPARFRRLAEARHVVCWRARRRGLSFPEIGWHIGRDHTTVMHACDRIDADRRLVVLALALNPDRSPRMRVA
jgi:chromosomal replication initiator protein